MGRITESELILPSLYLMNLEKGGYIKTSELKKILPIIMKPSGEDIEKSPTRKNETKFIQKIGNLKSHKTFLKNDLATDEEEGFKITNKGKKYLEDNLDILEYLMDNDFEWSDIKKGLQNIYKVTSEKDKKVEFFDENILIKEGVTKFKKIKTYERSNKLRNLAIDYFKKDDGKLYCECCSFSFDLFYGENISNNYIEIHHKRPIFQYEGEDINKSIEKALINLSPLCSNCHRMIHREKNTRKINDIVNAINKNGVFNILNK